ncbi:MAG: sulfide/dihydroorotate dehydrogenase-like FAD/NAD-binding protein [Clostridia bacterium]|nr:sulfide/dihydroorotate dehydrogenase-like FAD/NAD-binding protein [Clostridia bacterium]
MFEILEKRNLAPMIYKMVFKAPEIAAKARAGQFAILRIDDGGERIPLTIADVNSFSESITMVFQITGLTTEKLSVLEAGEYIKDAVGPLGKPSRVENFGTVACVGGGVGIAAVYPIAKALEKADNQVISLLGARSEGHLIFREELQRISSEFYAATEDGSFGSKGFITDPLKELLGKRKIDRIVTVGPGIMMKAVAEVSRPFGIPTVASLNPIMVDGTGMCGACRVTVGQEIKFACVDGPEFDAHEVKWDEFLTRLNAFKEEERLAMDAYHKEKCVNC